jgi:hypothetical protein
MKENKTETTLSTEKLGDDERLEAVLAGWGMDASAVERMLDQHRALRADPRRERPRRALRNYPVAGRPAPRASRGAHPAR